MANETKPNAGTTATKENAAAAGGQVRVAGGEQTEGVSKGKFQIIQAPKFQQAIGQYEAVARLDNGQKITVRTGGEGWEALEKELKKQGYTGDADLGQLGADAQPNQVDAAQQSMAYNTWRAERTERLKSAKAESGAEE